MIWPPPRKMASGARATSMILNLVLRIAVSIVSEAFLNGRIEGREIVMTRVASGATRDDLALHS